MSAWHVYVLRCADDTLYTGIAIDVARRLREHNGELANGAKYTAARRPVTLVYCETCDSRAAAAKREAAIKRLPRNRKLTLIGEGWHGLAQA